MSKNTAQLSKMKGDYGGHFQNLNGQRLRVQGDQRRSEFEDRQLKKFVWAYNGWVDRPVLERLNFGDQSALKEALDQIHFRSLKNHIDGDKERARYGGVSYKEVLEKTKPMSGVTKVDDEGEWQTVSRKKKSGARNLSKNIGVTIFLHNIPDDSTGKEIWNLFQSCGQILDIILPKKRDKLGKRFGFVKVGSEREAGAIICNAKSDKKIGSKIQMSINNKSGHTSSKGKGIQQPRETPKYTKQTPGQVYKAVKEANHSSEASISKEEIPFSKRMFEFTEVEVDEEVENALNKSKIGYTWFEEDVKDIRERLRDMGLGKYRVISLSSRKFLISKDDKESWGDLDSSDLSVWFCLIRNFEEEDQIISRTVWLECRGLPMPAWKEENLRAYTDRLGKWISWSYQSDSLGEFFNPLICIDTNEYDTIRERMKILYKGVQREISFVEVLNMEYLKDKILPMELSEIDSCVIAQPSNPVKDNSDVHKQDSGEISKGVKNSVNEVSQGIENKQNTAEQEPHPSFPVLGNETDIFKDYRLKSASSEVCSEGSVKGDENLRSEICIPDNSHSSQSTLCIGIDKKLKVKSIIFF